MSLSRSPSPHPGGGWSSPGLTPGSGSSTPRGYSPSPASLAPGISWAAAKAKRDEVHGYPSFSTRNSGFFSRQKRRISARLPSFRGKHGYVDSYGHAHRAHGRPFGILLRRGRSRFFFGLFLLWIGYLCFWSSEWQHTAIFHLILTPFSSTCSYIPTVAARRRTQIRDHPGLERRGRRDGVERRARVGNRAQQHLEQTAIREAMGLRTRGRQHAGQEAIFARMARELGEERYDPRCHAQVPASRVVLVA